MRALLFRRQGDIQCPQRGGALHSACHHHLQRVTQVFDAHALDGQVAFVRRALRVGDVQGVGQSVHVGASMPGLVTPWRRKVYTAQWAASMWNLVELMN